MILRKIHGISVSFPRNFGDTYYNTINLKQMISSRQPQTKSASSAEDDNDNIGENLTMTTNLLPKATASIPKEKEEC